MENSKVLVLGGTGFIGRHLVDHIVQNKLASKVCVVDKVPPQMAWFNEHHQKTFSHPSVEFKSANLINPASCQNAFSNPDGPFDYVINLASETRLGLADNVYQEGIVKLSLNCAKEAAKQRVQKYIEVSTGQIYSTEKHPITEKTKTDPWTLLAKCKLQVEEELKSIPGLSYAILRPAMVYGIADKNSLVPRIIIGAIYKHLGETMKLLWTKDLHMNTVHVSDFCAAICHVLRLDAPPGEVYNVVDKGNSTQGSLTKLIASIFHIDYEFWGTAKSLLAKVDLPGIMEDINDKHLVPWAEMCSRDGITNTPLTPYLYQELLADKHLYLDGSKLEETGFQYKVPCVTEERLKEIIDDYITLKLFPSSILT